MLVLALVACSDFALRGRASWPLAGPEDVFVNDPFELYAFDPEGRRAATVGAFTLDGEAITDEMVDIAASPDGALYGLSDGRLVGAGASVQFIDPASGGSDGVIVEAGVYASSGDVAQAEDGGLFWTVDDVATALVHIDIDTGVVRPIGDVGHAYVWGLAGTDAELWGFLYSRELVRIDTATGHGTVEATLSSNWMGATAMP